MWGCLQLAVGLAVGRYFYGHFIKYSLALKAEVLNGVITVYGRDNTDNCGWLWLSVVSSSVRDHTNLQAHIVS